MIHSLAFLQGQELWIVLIVVLVLFGGKKIPELMRGVGKGVGELQKGLEEGRRSVNQPMPPDDSGDAKSRSQSNAESA
jgi:sec-independent protein translocase protein TatA